MVSHVTLRAESVPGGERNEMYSSVMSGTIFGIQGMVIQVEADMSEGLPGVHLVGSLSREVQESGERIRTALRNSGFYRSRWQTRSFWENWDSMEMCFR